VTSAFLPLRLLHFCKAIADRDFSLIHGYHLVRYRYNRNKMSTLSLGEVQYHLLQPDRCEELTLFNSNPRLVSYLLDSSMDSTTNLSMIVMALPFRHATQIMCRVAVVGGDDFGEAFFEWSGWRSRDGDIGGLEGSAW
jgi:hypothetical protein